MTTFQIQSISGELVGKLDIKDDPNLADAFMLPVWENGTRNVLYWLLAPHPYESPRALHNLRTAAREFREAWNTYPSDQTKVDAAAAKLNSAVIEYDNKKGKRDSTT